MQNDNDINFSKKFPGSLPKIAFDAIHFNSSKALDVTNIALVNMPFYSTKWASIQIGILKSVLQGANFHAADLYLNLAFAKGIGWKTYDRLSLVTKSQVGEWLFAFDLYGNKISSYDDEYFDFYEEDLKKILCHSKDFRSTLKHLRYYLIPQFLDACLSEIQWQQFGTIGFSCTFQQVVPSLAMAKRIKDKFQNIKIIFGGSGVEGKMGEALLKSHNFIDAVVSGEGEQAIVNFIKSNEQKNLKKNQGPKLIKGVGADMNNLPLASYDSYYKLCKDFDFEGDEVNSELSIPIEFSRGCWWGEKKHCTFCGLNGETMRFRSKSYERALEEIDTFSQKYNRYIFQVVDNILDYKYFKTLLPKLKSESCHFEFFFEVKANLKPADLSLLKEAGCHHIQPGIESFSTHVLQLMNKGTTSLNNIVLLKWSNYYDIFVSWNLLYGFPGEEDQDYLDQCKLIDKISHLTPPSGASRIRMDRFSPNFNKRNELSFEGVKYAKCYDYIYPEYVNKWDIAYYYDSTSVTDVSENTYQTFEKVVNDWTQSWKMESKPTLFFRNGIHCLHVVDNRTHPKSYKLIGLHRLIFLLTMDLPCSGETILKICSSHEFGETEITSALHDLLTTDIIIDLDQKFFNLALPWQKNWIHKEAKFYEKNISEISPPDARCLSL